uniref:Predicted protein n=1 Tax=Hordeum vulgare subsp. vulgare TaxID=112509 RepID=F2DWB1_HORVV|nr:predicted protein [Hordeum vulgare subsp. vulgare]
MTQYPPGKALYANFGGVHPHFDLPSLHKLILFIQYHQHCRNSGFRWIVGRVSNVKAMELYKRIGARVLKEVNFERKGKTFRLFFFDFDLHGETFNFCLDNLDKLNQKLMERNMLKNSKL